MIDFKPFPKIARLRRDIVITEKLDGTNAVIYVGEDGVVRAGSRTRWLDVTSGQDNFGFAGFVAREAATLLPFLGPGYHYGEWWGVGIQIGYGLTERRLSFFNPKYEASARQLRAKGLPIYTAPVLYHGPFCDEAVQASLDVLRFHGSVAAPGWKTPEGVVVYHAASGQSFKVTLQNDAQRKGVVEREEVA